MASCKVHLLLVMCVCLLGCFQTDPPVRPHDLPKLYTKVTLPEPAYNKIQVANDSVSLEFEGSAYAELSTIKHPDKNKCCATANPLPCCQDIWFDLDYKAFNASLNFTYKRIESAERAESIKKDEVLSNHINTNNGIAEVVEETAGGSPQGYAFVHTSYNNAGEPERFYLVDAFGQNILLGSLIFNVSGQDPDSLAPYVSFIQKDIAHLISTLTFQNGPTLGVNAHLESEYKEVQRVNDQISLGFKANEYGNSRIMDHPSEEKKYAALNPRPHDQNIRFDLDHEACDASLKFH